MAYQYFFNDYKIFCTPLLSKILILNPVKNNVILK